MVVASALLAVITGLGIRAATASTPANVVAGGTAADLGLAGTVSTSTSTTTTAPPATEPGTTVPETTTSIDEPDPPAPTSSVAPAAPGRPLPPRPHVTYTATSSLSAWPKQQGTVSLSCCPGGPPGAITFPNPRQIGNNPNAKVPLVFLVKHDLGEWLEVYVPARPNGRTAFIRRDAVDLQVNPYRVEIYLREFVIRVYEGTNVKLDAKIGTARSSTPTPVGVFYTTELVRPPSPGGPYGPYAFGLSGFSDVYYSFGGGPGQIGMHGTNQPSAIGTQVSHGCIRMLNQNITYLASFLPLGTPVIINDYFN